MPDTAVSEVTEIEFTSPVQSTAPAVRTEIPPAPLAPPQPMTMLDIIDRASRDSSVDIDKLERLISLKREIDAGEARREFDAAMSRAQEEMRPIRANLENPQTRSEYADYAALDRAIRPIYSRHGFSLSFGTADTKLENHVRVVCTVAAHGHREYPFLDMPADGKGARGNDVMTKTHATGAAITYGKRYLLGMIFNLAVTRDDDGNGASDDDVERMAAPDALRGRDGKLLSQYASDKAKTYTRSAIESINLAANSEAVKDWRRANFKAPKGSNISPLAWLEFNAPSEFERVKTAYENVTGEQW